MDVERQKQETKKFTNLVLIHYSKRLLGKMLTPKTKEYLDDDKQYSKSNEWVEITSHIHFMCYTSYPFTFHWLWIWPSTNEWMEIKKLNFWVNNWIWPSFLLTPTHKLLQRLNPAWANWILFSYIPYSVISYF